MNWLKQLICRDQSQSECQTATVLSRTEKVIEGKDSSSIAVHQQKNAFTSSLLNLGNRTRIVTEKANSTTYYIAQAMGTLKVAQ